MKSVMNVTAVYPVPPPTTNTLDPLQRSRLLKSTRKLGALLGATPRVLEAGAAIPPPLTPATRAFRREGKVFHNHSASSSTTSLSSDDGYHWALSNPRKQHHKKNASATSTTPIAIELPLANSEIKVLHKKTKSLHHQTIATSQQFSQPLLYRLRSLPVTSPIITSCTSSVAPPPNPGSQVVLLSPLSPTFGSTDRTSKRSSSAFDQAREPTDSDRRRKMAKLSRTLGENIPPELVFGPPPRSSSLAPSASSALAVTATAMALSTVGKRKRSATGAHRPRTSPSQSPKEFHPVPIPVPVVASRTEHRPAPISTTQAITLPPRALPVPIVTVTTTTAAGTTAAKPKRRRHRPRSLTLTHIPTPQREDIVVEQVQTRMVTRPRGPSRSLDEPNRRDDPALASSAEEEAVGVVDYGRRKEKEWSGEWNVRDMDEVMNALRGLRVR